MSNIKFKLGLHILMAADTHLVGLDSAFAESTPHGSARAT